MYLPKSARANSTSDITLTRRLPNSFESDPFRTHDRRRIYPFAPLFRYGYRVDRAFEMGRQGDGKGWTGLARLPWLATPPAFAHQRLLDSIFRPLGPILKRVAYTDEAEAMIDFVDPASASASPANSVLEQLLPHQRNFVVADRVAATSTSASPA